MLKFTFIFLQKYGQESVIHLKCRQLTPTGEKCRSHIKIEKATEKKVYYMPLLTPEIVFEKFENPAKY